jgi:hypothetical protein
VDASDLEQGDLVDLRLLPVVVAGEDGPTVHVQALEHQCVIVTQTCDLVRELSVEPFAQLAGIRDLEPEEWEDLRAGQFSARLYALPAGTAGLSCPAVDIRAIATIDKQLLLDDTLPTRKPMLSEGQRQQLGTWLGRRSARVAFEDALEDAVLRPLRSNLKTARNQQTEQGQLARAVIKLLVGVMAQALRVVYVVEPGTFEVLGLDDQERRRALSRPLIGKTIARARGAGWEMRPQITEPKDLTGEELFYELDEVDLDAVVDASYAESAKPASGVLCAGAVTRAVEEWCSASTRPARSVRTGARRSVAQSIARGQTHRMAKTITRVRRPCRAEEGAACARGVPVPGQCGSAGAPAQSRSANCR